MESPLQAQTLKLLNELLDTFMFNRKLILFNGMMLCIVIFMGVMNYLNTRETARLSARIVELLEKADAEQAAREATERKAPVSGPRAG